MQCKAVDDKRKSLSWGDRLRGWVGLGPAKNNDEDSAQPAADRDVPPAARQKPSQPAQRRTAASASRKKRSKTAVPVKRACNAFSYYVKDQARKMTEFSGDNMKVLAAKWNNLSQVRKQPYERQAANDSRRYQIELAQTKEVKVKRPCTGYMLFISDFMKNYAKNYSTVQQAVSAGAAHWNDLGDGPKSKWLAMGKLASEQYAKEKKRLDKVNTDVARTSAAFGPKKQAAVQAKVATKARAVTKAKVKPVPTKVKAKAGTAVASPARPKASPMPKAAPKVKAGRGAAAAVTTKGKAVVKKASVSAKKKTVNNPSGKRLIVAKATRAAAKKTSSR